MTVFTLSSPDIPSGGTVPPHFEFDGFGCSGQNQSPILQWSGAPVGTQSFAVTVYDPDAPTGSGWWHWFVVDLPATTAQLVPNAGAQGGAGLPAGARQIRNDYGAFAWGGVCPRRATSRTAMGSPCMRSACPGWTFPTTPPPHWRASWSTPTRWPRPASRPPTAGPERLQGAGRAEAGAGLAGGSAPGRARPSKYSMQVRTARVWWRSGM